MKKTGGLLAMLVLVLACGTKTNPEITDPVELSGKFAPPETTPKPQGTFLQLGLAGAAKVFCSAVFVSGRKPEEAIQHNTTIWMGEEEKKNVRFDIDYSAKSVKLTYGDTLVRSASYYGDCGCVIDIAGGIKFNPPVITTTLPDAATMPWPMGDQPEKISIPENVNNDSLTKVVKDVFREGGYTAAFLVLYKGKIMVEKYGEGITKDTQLESWSMGKSLTATLAGRMMQQGYFSLHDPAPVEAWQQQGDPRKEIKISDLLQMSSGLHFTAHRDPDADQNPKYLDHFYIYSGGIDAFAYSYSRPLQFPVGSTGLYRNCDPLTIGYIIKNSLTKRGEDYMTYPQRELFDKIGIRKQVLEPDPYGNYLLSGFDYGTARNWARIGLLYLQDGMWNNERLLPEGYNDFVKSPAPGWKDKAYGGFFWLNGSGAFPITQQHYYMAGAGGQYTIIIPEKDLVVVRMGHYNGSAAGTKALGEALQTLMRSIQ